MNRFNKFIFGLVLSFGLPWLFLIVVPYAKISGIEPVPFDPDVDEVEGMFPAPSPGIAAYGSVVYRREGCVNCHTQLIRNTDAGTDPFKRSFGRGGRGSPPIRSTPGRPTPMTMRDGTSLWWDSGRNGPDLVNVGDRRREEAWHHLHLYNARQIHKWSTMPGFRHLYKLRKIQGQRAADALDIEGDHAPPDGFEVVPTYDARALVGYLLSLKTAEKMPEALAGRTRAGEG